jgi:hypothetical protein
LQSNDSYSSTSIILTWAYADTSRFMAHDYAELVAFVDVVADVDTLVELANGLYPRHESYTDPQ